MGKFADRYFTVDPWVVAEDHFDPAYARVSESIFSLGNEYMGLRGYFDEGYSGDSLQGSYLNGVYERRVLPPSGYCGMIPSTEFMVNTVDWVYCRIHCNGQTLDLAQSRFNGYRRALDLRTGVLTRCFTWQVDAETELALTFERFLSMEPAQLGGQRLRAVCLRGHAALTVEAGLDFSRPHVSAGQNFFEELENSANGAACRLCAQTHNTRQTVCAMARFGGMAGTAAPAAQKLAANRFTAVLSAGQSAVLTRLAALVCARSDAERQTFAARCAAAQQALDQAGYDALQADTAAWWAQQWHGCDIAITGDPANQQGIRYCIFQLHQTLHTARHGAVIGAKGLTGEAYNGNTFWDTEVYCLPFYVFNNPEAARSILQFRYDTLDEARARAKALDCRGAFYPIATISGRECCDLWQHASLQLQASTGVMYGIKTYAELTGDTTFLYHQGAEMLVEICRMLASRGGYNPLTGAYGYYAVMGPDEFKMMVNNNAYTNFMAKKTFAYTRQVLDQMANDAPAALAALCQKLALTPQEPADWAEKAARMALNEDADSGLFEQNDGFFALPHLDVSDIPADQFPLYTHRSYERLYRSDMLKQPDVLMFMLLYSEEFSDAQLAANYDYYAPRCIHESSLSPSVHSILAQQLGRAGEARNLFGFATRMDLDNYNRNTHEGLHTTSIAGAWMNIVYGFAGLRAGGGAVRLAPALPAGWQGYAFHLLVRGIRLTVTVRTDGVTLQTEAGSVPLLLYGQPVTATPQPLCRALQQPKEVL